MLNVIVFSSCHNICLCRVLRGYFSVLYCSPCTLIRLVSLFHLFFGSIIFLPTTQLFISIQLVFIQASLTSRTLYNMSLFVTCRVRTAASGKTDPCPLLDEILLVLAADRTWKTKAQTPLVRFVVDCCGLLWICCGSIIQLSTTIRNEWRVHLTSLLKAYVWLQIS